VAEYAISFARSARKQLQVLDRALALRIVGRIESLAVAPRPVGCAKLEGGGGLWRIRVGDYRVIYEIDDDRRRIDVSAVRHRRDAYR
jgi:mRNA interferase RelE/StbE